MIPTFRYSTDKKKMWSLLFVTNGRKWIFKIAKLSFYGLLLIVLYSFINGLIKGDDKSFQSPRKIVKMNVIEKVGGSEIVFPLTLSGAYILNNPQICSGVKQVTVLIMVHTAPDHFERRQLIRGTYGFSTWYSVPVRLVFLLGLVKTVELQEKIQLESLMYKDIVQGNFIDSYHNLTHKGVMGFRWITEHCSHVKYVVKVDDDAIVDIWRFLNTFGKRNLPRGIFCRIVYHGNIKRGGKWKLEDSNWSSAQKWPWPYCPGFVVIITGSTIPDLFKAAHTTPFLWIDDVYLYGYLPHKMNVSLYIMPKDLQVTSEDYGTNCMIEKRAQCSYIAVSATEKNFINLWHIILKRNNKDKTKLQVH